MEELGKVLFDGFLASISLTVKIALIVVPLTVLYEFLRKRGDGKTVSFRFFGVGAKGLLPLITGLIVGLTYGAGVIIHSIRSSGMKKDEAFLILLFLSISHAMIEDTLIFVVVGADGFVLITWRMLLSLFSLLLAKKILETIKKRREPSKS